MASVENTKEHMHDVVGTPCCHGGWPAMEEVARAEPFLSLLMLVLSEWTIIMLDCAVAFCSLCLQMPSLQLGMSCPLALCYVKSECLCSRTDLLSLRDSWFSCLGWHMFVQKVLEITDFCFMSVSWVFHEYSWDVCRTSHVYWLACAISISRITFYKKWLGGPPDCPHGKDPYHLRI